MSEIIYGRKPILEWLESDLAIEKIVLAKESSGTGLMEIEKVCRSKVVTIQRLPRPVLDKMVGHAHHQGIAAWVQAWHYAEAEDILQAAQNLGEPSLFAILDGVQDPHNLGAILRSADGAGLHGIVIPKDNAVGITPSVVKASAGAIAHLPVARVTNVAQFMEHMKAQGIWFVGADETATQAFDQADYNAPLALVMGSEGKGLRRLVREKCDWLVSIPMYGKLNSLNVSVAAALLFFQARRSRTIRITPP